MFKRFFLTRHNAIVAVLIGMLAPVVHANPLRSPFYYTIDESAVATSPTIAVLGGTLFRDIQSPGPNLNGWVCSTDIAKGSCPQTTMEKNSTNLTRVTLRFFNKANHSQYKDLPINLIKSWISPSCSLFAKHAVGINDVESSPTSGNCSTVGLQISMPNNGLSELLPGDWLAELQLPYMQANGDGYMQARLDTVSFEIMVSDQDGANLFLDNGSLSFGSTPQSGAAAATNLYLYDPNHGTNQDTPLQLRMWDDYKKGRRDPNIFSIITSFQQGAAPPGARLDYTVSLPALGLVKVNNRQVYTIDLSHFPSWLQCPSAPQGELCAKIPMSATMAPFLATSKTSGPYKGTLFVAFGKSL